MGVDFYTCTSCGETFCDCGPFSSCEYCGSLFCNDDCMGSKQENGLDYPIVNIVEKKKALMKTFCFSY